MKQVQPVPHIFNRRCLAWQSRKREIKCTAEYTEGCAQRLTDALVDIYYQRKAQGRLGEIEKYKEDKTA